MQCGKVGSIASGFMDGEFCEEACKEVYGSVEVRDARAAAAKKKARKRPRISTSSSSSPRSEQAPRRSPRDRSPSPENKCIECGKVGTRISFLNRNFCEEACQEAHGREEVRAARARKRARIC